MHKDIFRFTYALNYVFQVTVCLLTPAAMWIGLGWLCCNRWGVGKWAMILSIVLGVVSGSVSMFRFLMTSARVIDPTAPESSGGSHEKKEEKGGKS